MISACGVTLRFGRTLAVDGVSFSVPRGQIMGLLGANGAGKSTLLNVLSGYYPPLPGTVVVGGYDLAISPRDAKSLIGYLPEQPPLYPEMTVREYLLFCCGLKRLRKEGRAEHLRDITLLTGIEAVQHRRISNLSRGYRQRLGLAQALVGSPDVLLLDEPTAGFDPAQAVGFRNLVRSLASKHTIVFSSHLLREVEEVCERVIILQAGRVVCDRGSSRNGSGRPGRFRVRVQMREQDLLPALRSLPSVVRADAQATALPECAEALVEVERGEPFERQLFTLLSGLQAPILLLAPVQDDLESIFMSATHACGRPQEEARG